MDGRHCLIQYRTRLTARPDTSAPGRVLKYKWLPRPETHSKDEDLPDIAGISGPVGSLARRRGLDAAFFLSEYSTLSPWRNLPGADSASLILEDAVRSGNLILVHGDFDADGITATATAVRVIRALGGQAQYYIPSRFQDGYGLGKAAIDLCIQQGVKVLITVDCGITSIDEVARLKENGVKVIITDHHKPLNTLPEADVVVDPELSRDSSVRWRYLSGAGVVHTVLRGLAERMDSAAIPELEPDLVSIGTVCDVVKLTGDNRVLVRRGLDILRTKPSPGVLALMRAVGIDYTGVTTRDISFGLGPVINSSGRIAHADQAVKLLLETEPGLAVGMASGLEKTNAKRKSLDSAVFAEADSLLANTRTGIAVAASEHWHAGVIGISASKLARQMNRPVVLVAWDGDTGRGSARGVPGKPVYPILEKAMENGLLLSFGGHDQAAGISLKTDRYAEFKSFVERTADTLYAEDSGPVLYIDGGLSAEQCNTSVLDALRDFEPFGEGNPEPVWIIRGVYPVSFRSVGQNGKHLQISFQSGNTTLRGIGFGMGHRTSELDRILDVAFTLSADSWRGGDAVQLVVLDIKPAAGRRK